MKTRRFTSVNEERILLSTMDIVSDTLAEAGAFIAGGAITSVFTNKEINDLDIYFPSEASLVGVIAQIFQEDHTARLRHNDDLGTYDLIFNGASQRTLLFKDKVTNQEIQFMTFKYFSDPREIFDSFDFVACMGAYDCAKGQFVTHPDFMKHNAQRYLQFNTGTDYPLMSLLRVDKYRAKGYSISKAELLRILMTCMGLNIDNWEDLKDHVGGMYGYDMSKVFDSDSEFSMDAAIEQLGNIHDKGLASNWFPTKIEPNFTEICKVFVAIPEGYDPDDIDLPFKDGYLYKCTSSDFSPKFYKGGKIEKYNLGDILDTKVTGKLYFHTNPEKPYVDTGYWVECKIVSGHTDVSSCSNQKIVHHGVLKVTRTFEFTMPNDSRTVMEEYLVSIYGRKVNSSKVDGNAIAKEVPMTTANVLFSKNLAPAAPKTYGGPFE